MIPTELKHLKQWCIWKYEHRQGKKTKVPYSIDNQMAKSNDERTWADYESARAAYQTHKADGLGFFFKEPYMGIDIDDIAEEIERFKRNDIADNLIFEMYESLKSYAEYSPSGTGIHIIIKGSVPGARRRKANVEMYDSGRFFTMTGNSLGKYTEVNEPNERTIDRLYRKYVGEQTVIQMPNLDHGVTHDLNESEIVARILNSKQADLFKKFMNDGWQELYASQSEADMSFANLLAFWCARDFTKMDSLFRQSSLMRGKWDERRGKTTYGEGTLYKAINEIQSVYTPTTKREPLKYDINFGTEKEKQVDKSYPARSYDDTGNAQRLLDRFEEIIKYEYASGKFYVYDGKVWKEDRQGYIRKLIDVMIEDMKNEPVISSEDVDEEEAVKLLRKHISSSRSNRSKTNLLNELKHHVSVLPEEFDQHDLLLNTENGYIDLTSGELYDHDKDKMFGKIASTEYTDTAKADTWTDFLNDIFDGQTDVIRFIQKAVGYSLTGSTKEEMMFILLGSGRNGKSLFINTLGHILGDYTTNMQAESLMVKKYGGGVNNDIARLQNARFVTSSEPNEGFIFDEGLIKQMTGEDKITARFLRQENFEFEAKFKIWLATNHKPIIRGTDDGIWRRLAVIPFTVQIPEHKVDKDLRWKLLREAPAILDWALEGCLMWQREGLELPAAIKEANMDYRKEMDITDAFIEDQCELGQNYLTPASELYKAYRNWAKENNEYDLGKIEFGKRMKGKFESKRSNGVKYVGIKVRQMYPMNF